MEKEIKNSKILVTGGAGFIGTTLSQKLINDNKVIIYDNLWRNAIKNTKLLSSPNLKFIKGDVLDFKKISQILKQYKPSIILHMAAIAGIDTVIKSPTKTIEVNIIGTYNILKAAKPFMKSIKRFIDFSTSEVFGIEAFRVNENKSLSFQPIGEARWLYAASKLASEHFTHTYHKEFGLKTVILRPFNVYGPGQVGEGAINRFIVRAIKNEPLEIHGDGDQIRSWCYIDDMVEGILLVLEKNEAIGEVFNIGNPRGTITILNLAEKIIDLANSKSKIVHIPKKEADVGLRVPDIKKATKILGFKPKIDLNEGLKRTINWYKQNL